MRYTSVCVSAAIATFGIATISAAADDALSYNLRGNAYMYRHDYDSAIAAFNQAIRLDPKYAVTYVNRGYVYEQKRDYHRAIADYDRALKLDPNNAVARMDREHVLALLAANRPGRAP